MLAVLMNCFFYCLTWYYLGELVCEQLPVDLCSYSIATSGKRCLLENYATKDRGVKYQCKTSEVVVGILNEWIEIDERITACGLSRNTVGISSDSLLQPQFFTKLCSTSCSQACPNIVDLYSNLALAEGTSIYQSFIYLQPLRLFISFHFKCQKSRTQITYIACVYI